MLLTYKDVCTLRFICIIIYRARFVLTMSTSDSRTTFRLTKRTRIFLLELLNIPYFQWWNKRTEPGFKTPDLPWPDTEFYLIPWKTSLRFACQDNTRSPTECMCEYTLIRQWIEAKGLLLVLPFLLMSAIFRTRKLQGISTLWNSTLFNFTKNFKLCFCYICLYPLSIFGT